jgi:flagellar motor switch protein FliN/FliY
MAGLPGSGDRMNPPEITGLPSGAPAVRALLDGWVEGLAELVETMTGQRPQLHWHPVIGSAADAGAAADREVLWWEQAFQFNPQALVWVGAPRESWEHAATLMLKAAGLETVPEGEAQKTWQEILSQWLSGLARSIGSALGQEVVCLAGAEHAPPADQHEWAVVAMAFEDRALPPLAVSFSAQLSALLTAPPITTSAPQPEVLPAETDPVPQSSRTMDLLLDVELPVSISFGRTELPLHEVLKLTTGSIVELNRGVNEPVEILVNHCLIARGEVVVIDGNYGVRIQRIVTRPERLRSLR